MYIEEVLLIMVVGSISLISLLVFIQKAKERTSRYFLAMTCSMVLWVVSAFLSQNTDSQSAAAFIIKIAYMFGTMFIAFYYLFSKNFPDIEEKPHIINRLFLLAMTLLALTVLFSDFIVGGVKIEDWGNDIVYGSGIVPFTMIIGLVVIYSLVVHVKKYNSLNERKKRKVQYFLVGFFIFTGINLFFNIVFPLFFRTIKYYYFGNYSSIIFIIFTAYAILKQRLFGVKLVLSALLLSVIGIILTVDVVVFTTNTILIALKIFTLLLLALLGYLLVRSVLKEIDSREKTERVAERLEESTNDLKALLTMSRIATSKVASGRTIQEILDSIPQQFGHLKYIAGVFFKWNPAKSQLKLQSHSSTAFIKKIEKSIGKKITDITIKVGNHPTRPITNVLKEEQFIIIDRLDQIVSNKRQKRNAKIIQKILNANAGILVPIITRGSIEGVLLVIANKKKDQITGRDEEVMRTFSNNLSLAYENAKLYEKVKRQLSQVKHANNELKKFDEAKNNFVSIVSHQLRTPITAIKGYMSMMLEGDFGSISKPQKEILENNLINTERLVKLIDLFLDITKIEAGKLILDFEKTNLSELTEGVIEELEPQAEVKGIKLKYTKKKRDIFIESDTERFRHAIVNLVDNAIKYTEKGSVTVNLSQAKNKVIITVKDTGVGINASEAKHLFEKFHRASGGVRINANGSGLGLYIVQKIVEGHGGKTWVESKGEGKGSTFFIEMPKKTPAKIKKKKKVEK